MKSAIMGMLSMALSSALVYFAVLLTEPPEINHQNCQPEGFIAKMKRAYDPLRFAVDQHTNLESYFKDGHHQDSTDMCEIHFKNDSVKLSECHSERRKIGEQLYKCYDFWTRQCRANGGRCQ